MRSRDESRSRRAFVCSFFWLVTEGPLVIMNGHGTKPRADLCKSSDR